MGCPNGGRAEEEVEEEADKKEEEQEDKADEDMGKDCVRMGMRELGCICDCE